MELSSNITFLEASILLLLAVPGLFVKSKKNRYYFWYSLFLIVYISLLRRTPGHFQPPRFTFAKLTFMSALLNTLFYIPLGFFCRKKYWLPFALSLAVEIIQHFAGMGMFDITDIVFNCLGAGCGMMLHVLCQRFPNQIQNGPEVSYAAASKEEM